MRISAEYLAGASEAQIAAAVTRYEELLWAMVQANDALLVKLETRDDTTPELLKVSEAWWSAYHEAVEEVRLVKAGETPGLDAHAIANALAAYETLVNCMVMINNEMLAAWRSCPDATNGQIAVLNSWSIFHNGLFRAHRQEVEKALGRLN